MNADVVTLNLLHFFKKYFFIIVGATILGSGLSVMVMDYFNQPTYSSQAELLVNQQSEPQIVQYNEIQTSIRLINTYQAIITGDAVLGQVEELFNNKYDLETLKESVSVYQPIDSQTFYVSAIMDSPIEAQLVVQEILIAFEELINDVYGAAEIKVTVLSNPKLNKSPISPNRAFYLLMGAVISFVSIVLGLTMVEVLDKTVKDDAIFDELNLIKLGKVPQFTTTQSDLTEHNSSEVLSETKESGQHV